MGQHIIAAKLILSECDLSKRHVIFDQIIEQMGYFESRSVVNISAEVQRRFHIPNDYLLNFLQYYSSYCEKQGIFKFVKTVSSKDFSFTEERKPINSHSEK